MSDVNPKAWAEASAQLPAAILIVLVVLMFLVFGLLIWRGNERLGFVGVGTELRRWRQATEASAEAQRLLRGDFHVVVQWVARRLGSEPPPLPPIEDLEASAVDAPARAPLASRPTIEPPPATVRGGTPPPSRKDPRKSRPQ